MPHIHKDIDFTVSVFIVHSERVLLHIHKKYGMWLPPGGHIELDEDPVTAARREVQEECGLEVQLLSPREEAPDMKEEGFVNLVAPFYFNMHNAAPNHRHADFIYFALSHNDQFVPEHAGEIWRWWSREEIEAQTEMWPSVKFYSLAAIAEATNRSTIEE